MGAHRARVAGALALAFVLAPAHDTLAVRVNGAWREWWRGDRAPTTWAAADRALASAVHWRAASPGVAWGDAELSAPGEGWRTRLIVVRVDPAQARFALELGQGENFAPDWTVGSAGDSTLVAVNAGQFGRMLPWGWLVQNGRELSPPGVGPLSTAVVFDSSGGVRLVSAGSLAAVRAGGGIANGFQSYPTLLTGDGEVPYPLLAEGRGVDLSHRDSRVALGEMRDGSLLIAMTRFDALGDAAAAVPFGLTVPEMSALMGALGCRRAVSLDGGISGQLVVRQADGTRRAWTGWRRVPLGLIVLPNAVAASAVPSRQ